MIDAPARPVYRFAMPPNVDTVESFVTPPPHADSTPQVPLPPELIRYLLDYPSLVLCERPFAGATSIIRDLLKATGKRLLLVVDEPATLIDSASHQQLVCEVDHRFRRSVLIAEATRFLQSQLTSELADLHEDIAREQGIREQLARIESHKQQTTTHQDTAERRIKQSAAWQHHLATQQHQNQLRSQIDSLRAQLAQPVGLLHRLLGRASTTDQQKQLAGLEAELQESAVQSIPEVDLYQTLLATELEQLQQESHQYGLRLQQELEGLPKPKLSDIERNQKQIELETRSQSLAIAADEFVWSSRSIVIATPSELSEFDRPGHFDKWILDVADATADQLRQCNRLGRSGLLFGDVPTLHPPGYRKGSVQPNQSVFEETWNECCKDIWAFEGTRLLAQAVRLPHSERTELKPEPIIGIEQHEARIRDSGTDLTLAEIAFEAGTSIAQATKVLIEQPEMPCLTTLGQPEWSTNSGKHKAHWLKKTDCESVCVCSGSIELSFFGDLLVQATFDVERFPTQTDAVAWLSDFVLCSSPTCVRTRVV